MIIAVYPDGSFRPVGELWADEPAPFVIDAPSFRVLRCTDAHELPCMESQPLSDEDELAAMDEEFGRLMDLRDMSYQEEFAR